MKLRTHTIPLPTDYVSELRNGGKRKKSRCFIEYFYDMEVGEHNSYGFYSKSWEVGKATAFRWIKEFNQALEIFDAARELKRKYHYQEATEKQIKTKKNDYAEFCFKSDGTNGTIEMERMEQLQMPIKSSLGVNDETNGTIGVEQSFIISNNNKDDVFLDSEFMRFITEIKRIIKNVGNIEDIYQAYKKVKDVIDLQTLSKIYREYSQETKSDRKVGLAKFLDDLIFLSYCKLEIIVEYDGDYIRGIWNKDKELFFSQDKTFNLKVEKFGELEKNNRIQIIRYLA